MIAKISDPRAERVAGLIYYLFGPGRREEHVDPHLIAGWRHPAELEPPLRPMVGLTSAPPSGAFTMQDARPDPLITQPGRRQTVPGRATDRSPTR